MSIPDESGLSGSEARVSGAQIAAITTALKRNPNQENTAPVTPTCANYFAAWFFSWLGIALAGGVFGFGLGILFVGSAGLFVGPVTGFLAAGIVGAPLTVTIGTLTWLLWLTRFWRAAPAVAGACTGVVSTVMLFRDESDKPAILVAAVCAGLIGGAGGYLAAGMYWNSNKQFEQQIDDKSSPTWQFSLSDLFLRFTVASLLLAAWIFFFSSFSFVR